MVPRRELLVITPKGVLFIFQTDLVKYVQMQVNASNLKKFYFFTPKGHLRACWFILIILQLQRTAIENPRINTIDMIDEIERINFINKYEDNRYG